METKDKKVSMLKELYKATDNREISGYIGDGLDNVFLDDNGDVIFSSHHESGNLITDSYGVVLTDSVLIKQIQSDGKNTYHQIFSWDVPNKKYSYLLLDGEDVMDYVYEKLKAHDYCLCNRDIVDTLLELKVKFSTISNVLLDQEFIPPENSRKK